MCLASREHQQFLLPVLKLLFADVEDKCMDGFELGLLDERSLVACHERGIFQSFAGHLSDLRKLGIPFGSVAFLAFWSPVGVARHVDHALVAGRCLAHIEYASV